MPGTRKGSSNDCLPLRAVCLDVAIDRVSPDAKLPSLSHHGDAGYDLYANETLEVLPGNIALVATGLKLAVPVGFECQVRPKSGLALNHGVTLLNSPGTIDAGYRGEVKVILINLGKNPFLVEKGKKIAQLVFNKIESADFKIVERLDETRRGDGGFGSTGLV